MVHCRLHLRSHQSPIEHENISGQVGVGQTGWICQRLQLLHLQGDSEVGVVIRVLESLQGQCELLIDVGNACFPQVLDKQQLLLWTGICHPCQCIVNRVL